MKLNYFLLLLFIAGSLTSVAQRTFEISIIQDGNTITAGLTNEVVLNKAPFKIQVKLNKLEGVYLFAAFNDSIYKIGNTEKIPGFDQVPVMVMAENAFNPGQEIIINNEGWAYWYYNPENDQYSFDKDVVIEGTTVTATKTVKQFYNFASGKEFPVAEVKDSFYLFFFSAKKDKAHNLETELQRFKIRINWK